MSVLRPRARKIVRNPKFDQITGLRMTHVSALWKAAKRERCGEPSFDKTALARLMRKQVVQFNTAGALWSCCYCSKMLHGDQLSLDHKIPIAHAGSPGNTIDNLAFCCADCNTLKGDTTDRAMILLRELLHKLDNASRASILRRLGSKPGWLGSKPQHVVRVVTSRGPRG